MSGDYFGLFSQPHPDDDVYHPVDPCTIDEPHGADQCNGYHLTADDL